MHTRIPGLLFCVFLFLVACDSSTAPHDGGGFDLAGAFDDEVAEFEQEEDGERLRFDGIDFGGRSSSTLTDADKAILDGFAAVFAGMPNSLYRVESHTDERGAASANASLTRQRAEAVRAYLIDVGGGPGPYVAADGRGESVPLDDRSSPDAWARNDRVEVVVSEPDGPVKRVVLEARRLDVVFDCDADPEPGVDQPGDFWVTVSIRLSQPGGFFRLDEVVDELVTASDGESFELDIAASAVVLPVEADILEIAIELEEFDGSGTFDFRRSRVYQFTYVPELECWGRADGLLCGVPDGGAIVIENGTTGGPPCETTLQWSLRLEDVP